MLKPQLEDGGVDLTPELMAVLALELEPDESEPKVVATVLVLKTISMCKEKQNWSIELQQAVIRAEAFVCKSLGLSDASALLNPESPIGAESEGGLGAAAVAAAADALSTHFGTGPLPILANSAIRLMILEDQPSS